MTEKMKKNRPSMIFAILTIPCLMLICLNNLIQTFWWIAECMSEGLFHSLYLMDWYSIYGIVELLLGSLVLLVLIITVVGAFRNSKKLTVGSLLGYSICRLIMILVSQVARLAYMFSRFRDARVLWSVILWTIPSVLMICLLIVGLLICLLSRKYIFGTVMVTILNLLMFFGKFFENCYSCFEMLRHQTVRFMGNYSLFVMLVGPLTLLLLAVFVLFALLAARQLPQVDDYSVEEPAKEYTLEDLANLNVQQ